MKAWLKWGLILGISFTILFFILNLLGGFSLESNILPFLLFIPIFPLGIFIIFFADGLENGTINLTLLFTIVHILVFIGYFIWGAIIGKIISKRKHNNISSTPQ